MKPAPIPEDEAERLESLARYDILDTGEEATFDNLARLAAHICDVPIALVSIIDADRQWFKARHGLDTQESPRDISFCGHAVYEKRMLLVPDATQDERFADNPFVAGEFGLRFYAGEPLTGREGQPLGTLCIIDQKPRELSDEQIAMLKIIAEQVTSQLELRREIATRARLEAVKDEFISTVSHELRTPLTSIRGALGLVVGGALGDLPPTFASMLEIAATNADRLVRLINDILDVEKMESGRMDIRREPLRVEEVVSAAIDANASYGARYEVTFEVRGSGVSAPVLADRDRLRQVLDNLLSNAAKYSPRGGTVHVDIGVEGEQVVVGIRDYGRGIPEEFRGRIFERFAQADSSDTRQRGGTGLGLAISKKIIDEHGGEIGFDTTPEGTRFWFRLPLADRRATVSATASAVTARPGARVLVVEDDPDIARLLDLLLENQGYRVSLASDAETALEALSVQAFDAMTVDLGLPGKDGLSLIRAVRANAALADLPIVVVSANATRGEAALNGSAASVVDWILKPIDEPRLLAAVARAARGRAAGATGAPRVLHVEVDDDLAEVIRSCLADRADVSRARTLREARQQLRQTRFDLVVLDLTLPDGSGAELLAELDEHSPPTPVVIFSDEDPERRVSDRVQRALVKSRQSEGDLVATITNLLEQSGKLAR